MTSALPPSYFSVSFNAVTVHQALAYDLYINSSSVEGREHFIRISKRDDILTPEDLARYESKYLRVYVAETDRSVFLRSLVAARGVTIAEKTTVLKDSAIHHLKNLFEQDATPESLGKTLVECRDVVEGMIDVLEDYDIDSLKDLIADLSFHDFYTYDHSINVCMYCILFCRMLNPGAPRSLIIQAGMGGLLHDLGKIKIPTQILNKTEKLDPEEFAEIQKHPDYGQDLLAECKAHLPKSIDAALLSRVIHEHHENYNGTGYPQGLEGEEIHLFSRITAIADFFDAVTTKRSYHEPLSPDEALVLMQKSEGKKIDPALFRIFAENMRAGEISRIARKEGPRETNVSLPDDFDPCQPHRVLPFSQNFGQVKLIEEEKGGHAKPAIKQLKKKA